MFQVDDKYSGDRYTAILKANSARIKPLEGFQQTNQNPQDQASENEQIKQLAESMGSGITGDSGGSEPKMEQQATGTSTTTPKQSQVILTMQEKQNLSDLAMIQNQGQVIYAIPRITCKSGLLVEALNTFGQDGGFEAMIKLVQNPETGLDHMRSLASMLADSQKILHQSLIVMFAKRFSEAVEHKIVNATEAQIKAAKYETIEKTLDYVWSDLLQRVLPELQLLAERNRLQIKLSVMLLQEKFGLEKRIEGARIMDSVCKRSAIKIYETTQHKEQKTIIINEVVKMLSESDVISMFFSNKNIHSQLVQRSENLLKLLLSKEAVSDEQLQMVWQNCSQDEAMGLDLYAVLKSFSGSVSPSKLTFFIDMIALRPVNRIRGQELELMKHLANQTTSATEPEILQLNQSKVMDFLWRYLFTVDSHQYLDKVLANKTCLAFIEILGKAPSQVVVYTFENIVKNLQQGIQGYLNIKIAAGFFRDYSYTRDPNKKVFAGMLQETYKLFDVMFAELKLYMSKVRVKVQELADAAQATDKPVDYDKLSDTVLCDLFAHSDQITERMNFIKDFVKFGDLKLKYEHLSLLWQELIEDNALRNDQRQVYTWLNKMCEAVLKEGENVVDPEELIMFFKEKINSDTTSFQNLSIEGYYCIQSFFVLINKKAKRLIILGEEIISSSTNDNKTITRDELTKAQHAKQASETYTGTTTTGTQIKSYSYQNPGQVGTTTTTTAQGKVIKTASIDPEKLEVLVRVKPHELEGINGLWRIAIDCQDKKVGESVTKLLLGLHTSLDFGMEDQIPIFEDQYIASCFRIIKEQMKTAEGRSEEQWASLNKLYQGQGYMTNDKWEAVLPVQEKRIMRCLNYLLMVISFSERESTRDLVPHASRIEAQPTFYQIEICDQVNQSGCGFRQKFFIQVRSNSTIWELKKYIAMQISIKQKPDGQFESVLPMRNPGEIKLIVARTWNEIKDEYNGDLVSTLKFNLNETVNVSQKHNLNISKFPLLNDDQTDLNDRLKFVFNELFDRYCIEDPEGQCGQIMTVEQARKFIEEATKEPCLINDNRIGLIMSWDSDSDGKLTRQDFMEFYSNSCFGNPELVRRNLTKYNYRADMKQAPKAGDDDNVLQARKTQDEMPRCKISNNQDYFSIILQLLDYNIQVHSVAKQVVNTLVTNAPIYWSVIWLDQRPESMGEFKWEMIFPNEIKVNMYTLDLMQSIVEDPWEINNPLCEEAILRKTWVVRFIKLDGFKQLQSLLEKALSLTKRTLNIDDITIEKNNMVKRFLNQIIRVIKTFVNAATKAHYSAEQAETIHLLRKHSSVRENVPENEEKQPQQETNKQDTDEPFSSSGANESKPQGATYGPEKPPSTSDPQSEAAQKESEDKNANATQTDASASTQQLDFEQTPKFKLIVEQIREAGASSQFIQCIDFESLQKSILDILALFLTNKTFKGPDQAIITNSLRLEMIIMIENQELIEDFYTWKYKDANESCLIQDIGDLLLCGIYSSKAYGVRSQFKENLELMAEKITKNSGMPALLYLIKLLKENIPREDLKFPTKESGNFFKLFGELITQYQIKVDELKKHDDEEMSEFSDELDLKALLYQAIDLLKKHKSSEIHKQYVVADNTLVGLITLSRHLIEVFIKNSTYEELTDFINQNQLMELLFFENLFFHPEKTGVNGNRCKSKESRDNGYHLLLVLIKALKPKELCGFFEGFLLPIIKDIPIQTKWKFEPSNKVRSQVGKDESFAGITNLSMICYMISMLQQFFMVPQFRYSLFKAVDNTPEDMKEYKEMMIDDNMLRQIQKLFGFLELSQRQSADPTQFCFAFKDDMGQPTNVTVQCDAQEFVNFFFDRMENLLKPTSQRFLVQDVFQGRNINQRVCLGCGYTQNNIEEFYQLSLEVRNKNSIFEGLQKLIDSEVIQDYNCGQCKQTVDLKQRTLLGAMPNVLIVHLQRITLNYTTFENEKLNNKLEFPKILDLNKYSLRKNIETTQSNKPADQNIADLMELSDDHYIYKLVGVNVHRGSANRGHYWSVINIKRGQKEEDPTKNEAEWMSVEKDTWRKFDDETVGYFGASQIEQETFGGDGTALTQKEIDAYLTSENQNYGKSAYMLVYEKKLKNPVREIRKRGEETEAEIYFKKQEKEFQKELTQNPLEQGLEPKQNSDPNTANEQLTEQELMNKAESAPAQVSSVEFPGADTEMAQTNNTGDAPVVQNSEGQIEEEIAMVNYRQIRPFVPNWIRELVTKDNIAFIVDRQIYSDHFFELIRHIMQHISNDLMRVELENRNDTEQKPYYYKMKQLALQIGQRISFDFLTHFKDERSSMGVITRSMSTIFLYSDWQYNFCGDKADEPSILCQFLQDYYIKDRCENFMHLMLKCPDATARYNIGKLTSELLNRSFKLVGQCSEDGEKRYHPKVTLLRQKIDEFMTSVIKVIHDREFHKSWTKLQNFYTMLYDIAVGGIYQAEYLLKKFEFVTELCDHMLQNLSPKMSTQVEKRYQMGGPKGERAKFEPLVQLASMLVRCLRTERMDENTHTLCSFIDSNNPSGPRIRMKDPYMVSQQTFDFFTNQDLMNLIIGNGFASADYGRALAHLCFNNKKLSKHLCQYMLTAVKSNPDQDKLPSFLDIVEELVQIRDDLQTQRLEWIFGFGFIKYYETDEKLRIGLDQTYHMLKCDAYGYKSMINYEDDSVSLLNQLWTHKDSMKSYSMVCLDHLLSIINSDESVQEWFSNIPGVTYQYARYTDWITPYLSQCLATSTSSANWNSNYANSYSTMSALQTSPEKITALISKMETFQTFLDLKDGVTKPVEEVPQLISATQGNTGAQSGADVQMADEEEKVETKEQEKRLDDDVVMTNQGKGQNEDGFKVIKCKPLPIVVCQHKGTQVVKEMHSQLGQKLTISALKCQYLTSRPTGSTNLAVSEEYLNKYNSRRTNNKAIIAQNQVQVGIPVGRPDVNVSSVNAGASMPLRVKNKAVIQRQHQIAVSDLETGQPAEIMENPTIIVDGDDQWNAVNQEGMQDEEEGYKQDIEDQEPQGQPSQPQNDPPPPQEAVVEAEVAQVQDLDDSFEGWTGDALKTCNDMTYMFNVSNMGENTIFFKIQLAQTDISAKINLKWPKSGIKGTIEPFTQTTVCLLEKIEPTEVGDGEPFEIEKLDIKFLCKVKSAPVQQQNEGDTRQIATSSVANQGTTNNVGGGEDFPSGFGDAGVPELDVGQKQCPTCTIINSSNATVCHLCGSSFPA